MTAGVMDATSTALRTDVIDDAVRFANMHEEWDELLRSSASDCLFLTWEWLHTWWKHLAAERRLSILAIRRGDLLIGLAPCVSCDPQPLRLRPLPMLEFLGTGVVGSDYLDCLVREGCEAEAVQGLAEGLATQHTRIDWRQLAQGSQGAATARALQAQGWTAREAVTHVCPYIPLRGRTWESYLKDLGAEHRYAFHRKWKRLQRDFGVRFEEVRTAEQCSEAMELVFDLHTMRWRGRGGSDAFHTSDLRNFHREFSFLALKRGWLRLYLLWLDGKPAACLYGFLYGRKFYFYQSGFDSGFENHSPGMLTMGLAIQQAIEEGAEEYDLLHGTESYKKHWSRDTRGLTRLQLFPPGGCGWLCRRSTALEQASRKLARRMLLGGKGA